MKKITNFRTLIYIVLATVLLSCGKDEKELSDFDQQSFVNSDNMFDLQVDNIENVDDTETYKWKNDGTKAKVTSLTTLESGNGTITVKDGDGKEVYSEDITKKETMDTAEGQPGTWTIEIKLSDAAGSVKVNIEKS